jgi:hypothetical protein
MGYNITFQYTYLMCNAQIKVIGISSPSNIPFFLLEKNPICDWEEYKAPLGELN